LSPSAVNEWDVILRNFNRTAYARLRGLVEDLAHPAPVAPSENAAVGRAGPPAGAAAAGPAPDDPEVPASGSAPGGLATSSGSEVER
jgi:hypothetical protein